MKRAFFLNFAWEEGKITRSRSVERQKFSLLIGWTYLFHIQLVSSVWAKQLRVHRSLSFNSRCIRRKGMKSLKLGSTYMAPGVAGLCGWKTKWFFSPRAFSLPRHLAAQLKRSQNNLPVTGGTSSSNLVDCFGQTVCYVYGCVFASGKNLYSTGE